MALGVEPNAAHYALAELAKTKNSFLTLTQNVDGRCCKTRSDGRADGQQG